MATNTSFHTQIRDREPDFRGPWRRGFRWLRLRFDEYRVCTVTHPVEGVRDRSWLEWKSDQPLEPTWETQDGRILKISEMTTEHLNNTINWMRRVAAKDPLNELSLPKHPKYNAMLAEIEKRRAAR